MTQALAAEWETHPEFPQYRWTPEQFVRACETGIFDGKRVELLDGVVVPVQIGPWHGITTGLVFDLLPFGPGSGAWKASMTLPSGPSSLPDPDLWVLRVGAKPKEIRSERSVSWHASDVLLVVEVSDESRAVDLGYKAQLYGSAGYPEYWVVTKETVYVHREPASDGYQVRDEYHPGQQIPVPYAPGHTVDVSLLLSAPTLSGDDH